MSDSQQKPKRSSRRKSAAASGADDDDAFECKIVEAPTSTDRVTRKRSRTEQSKTAAVATAASTAEEIPDELEAADAAPASTTPLVTDGMSDAEFESLLASGAFDDAFDASSTRETKDERPAKKARTSQPAAAAAASSAAAAKKKSSQPLSQRVSRLFYKNGPFAKMSDTELRTVFCAASLRKLSPEQRRELAAFLPTSDTKPDTNEPDEQIFWDASFRNSVETFQSMVNQGWMLPSRNLRSQLEQVAEQSQDAGTAAPRMKEFWLDNIDSMSMKWISDLSEQNGTAGAEASSSTAPSTSSKGKKAKSKSLKDFVDEEE